MCSFSAFVSSVSSESSNPGQGVKSASSWGAGRRGGSWGPLMLTCLLFLLGTTPAIAEYGWIMNPANGHYYRFTDQLPWLDAEAQAVEWGGHLVTINDRNEEVWLKGQFGTQELYWIGFNAIRVEAQWEWVSGQPVTYANWWTWSPQNHWNGLDQDGAVMNWGGGTTVDGVWVQYFGDYWADQYTGWSYRGILERDSSPHCTFSITPASQTFDARGGAGSVTMTATSGCDWVVQNVPDWITAQDGPEHGSGIGQYLVAPNPSTKPRSATINLSGVTLIVNQAGMTSAPQAQGLYPRKDLAFAQIAAGGGYETVVNITNRGTTPYAGTLSFFRASGQTWSPLINGNTIVDGKMGIALSPGATSTLRITVSGGVEVGFGIIKSIGQELTSCLEGTLTYYVKSGGKVVDSIGVPPSGEIYLTTVPFDDFSTIALALANGNTSRTSVLLKLVSGTGSQVSPPVTQLLEPNQHLAQYLRQLFPNTQMTVGRLEIQSDLPILATALTDMSGQFSSLPLLPAVKNYSFTANVGGANVSTGEISFWIDGRYAQGYARNVTENGKPVQRSAFSITGLFVEGVLQVYPHINIEGNEFYEYIIFDPFSLSMQSAQGALTIYGLSPPSYEGIGTITMTATN